MQLSYNHTDYLAPQSEVIVVRVESNFMDGSVKSAFSGNYSLQSGGLGHYDDELD